MEGLEGRTLFNVILTPTPVHIPVPVLVGSTDLTAEPDRTVTGSFTAAGSQGYRVELDQGDFLALTVSPGATKGLPSSNLLVDGPSGNVIAQAGASPNPNTGLMTDNASLGFTAPSSGAYQITLSTSNATGGSYSLNMHRDVLASGTQKLVDLQKSGPMYASLVGNLLEISGPTGYGFAIRGGWSQTVTTKSIFNGYTETTFHGSPAFRPSYVTLYSSAYSSNGPLFLETAEGEVPFAVPSGETFTVTTSASTFGNVFGQVASIGANVGFPLNSYAQGLLQKLGVNLNAISLGSDWTIQLGSTIQQQRGISQALAGVPYIVYAGQAGLNVNFGKINITTNDPNALVAFANPTDPSLYIQYKGFSLEGSLNGMIPFTPAVTPTIPGFGPFFGNVYAQGGFQVGDLPFNVNGSITVNLDANGDGNWLGGQGTASQLFSGNAFSGVTLSKALGDVEIGVNGNVALGYQAAGFNLTVPVGAASFIYNGATQGAWVDGTTLDPLAGTPLDVLQIGTYESVEGAVYRETSRFGVTTTQYDLKLADTYKVFGATAALDVDLSNSGITLDGTADLFGVNIAVSGDIASDGDLSLTGSAGVNFNGLGGNVTVDFEKTGSVYAIDASLSGHAGFSNDGWGASLDVSAKLDITYSGGHIEYSGSASATGKVTDPIYSFSVTVSGSISNDEIVLSIAHIGTVDIPLPL